MFTSSLSRTLPLFAAAMMVGVLAGPPVAIGAQGDCSQPVSTGANPLASDCLFILRVAVNLQVCTPQACVCDPTGDGNTTASDALTCLKKAVGEPITLMCPCTTTTSSTTTSTTVTTSTTTTSSTTLPPGTTTTTIGGGTTTTLGATTTTLGGTTTTLGGTTTTLGGTTTTVPTTTTTLVAAECPSTVDLVLLAGTRNVCVTNADCSPVGACNESIGRCQTTTELDTGWTGIAHDADITDNQVVKANLDCGPANSPCGECNVTGLNPDPRNCRCANDNQAVCDEPFAADSDNCSGDVCNCYIGPPLALSAGNTPACVVNRFANDVSGTTNVDTGESLAFIDLRSVVFLGIGLTEPCPYCTGDTTIGDGVRDGTCVEGRNAGTPCDADGFNDTFPAPGGDGHSLDCFPDIGKNVSGAGLRIGLDQTTAQQDLPSTIECGFPPFQMFQCHCGLCSEDQTIPCSSDTDCTGVGTCAKLTNFEPLPTGCDNSDPCQDAGGGEGACPTGPDDKGCDAILRASGEQFIGCQNNADCDEQNIGVAAGNCTLTKRRPCFMPTIEAEGTPDPTFPVGVATFCIPPTANGGINSVAGLPGPGRVITQGVVTVNCTGGDYVPNVGCP